MSPLNIYLLDVLPSIDTLCAVITVILIAVLAFMMYKDDALYQRYCEVREKVTREEYWRE